MKKQPINKNILVIDDDEAIRKSFLLALEDAPYQIDTAASGMEGISKEQMHHYDLIFLDLKMPGLNGVQTLQALRQVDDKVPVYIITAFHKEFLDQLKTLEKEGINFELVRKPIGAEEILTLVNTVLEQPMLV